MTCLQLLFAFSELVFQLNENTVGGSPAPHTCRGVEGVGIYYQQPSVAMETVTAAVLYLEEAHSISYGRSFDLNGTKTYYK